ncbi:MAG: hypothetical protein L6R39_000191, partial [Caloplaca ligustica]
VDFSTIFDDFRPVYYIRFLLQLNMSKTALVSSASHFNQLLSTSKIVVVDFYADWCGPCRAIAPIYEQLSAQLSRPHKITFAKVDTERQKDVAQTYGVTTLPTFMVFKDTQAISTVHGADSRKLSEVVKKLVAEADSNGSGGFGEASSFSPGWLGASLPKGYEDVTDQVDVRGVDLLNSDSNFGNARTLFNGNKPSALACAEGNANPDGGKTQRDWIESDTDEQLMLFIPFQSTLRIHTLQMTSLPPKETNPEADEVPMRPKTLHLYINRAHILGFEEAEDLPATQVITLQPQDWDNDTGTAKVELRFVKFQKVTSLVLFVANGDGDGEKVRVDRLKIIGEKGEKRELGKLEKIGDEPGE